MILLSNVSCKYDISTSYETITFITLINLTYLTVEEARPVVVSYSEIYDLGITNEKVEDSLGQVQALYSSLVADERQVLCYCMHRQSVKNCVCQGMDG